MTKIHSWFLQENFYHVKNIIYNSFRCDKNLSLVDRGKFQCINLNNQDIGIFAEVRNIHSWFLRENFYMNTLTLNIDCWMLACEIACDFSYSNTQKILIHRVHKKSFSLWWWDLRWLFKEEFTEKADRQILQENGFSPVCVRICDFKVERAENVDPQTSQENGFSPV